MARRGRFGRSETGASNLSAMIRQLVSEQQAAEEKALMDAFYNGTQYNGGIPTMDDVKAFYAKWLDITGLEPSDADYQIINQKIETANNFDIGRTYKDLAATFDSTNGSNFDEILTFLKERAPESTDQEDQRVYQEAVGVFSKNYITYRGNDLVAGLISLTEYRAMSGNALSQVGSDNPIYGTMLNDSYDFEWRAESTRRWNLVQGGEMSKGAYLKWANSFKKDILGAGISQSSGLYAKVVAELGRVGKIAIGSAASKRMGEDVSKLSAMWNVLKTRYGAAEETFYFGKTQSKSDLQNEILRHPEWAQAYQQALQDNPNLLDPALAAAGITADDFLNVFERTISSIKDEAVLLESQGVSSGAAKWTALAYNSGIDSVFDYLRYVDSEWQKQRYAANENDQEMAWLDKEYTKFLLGQDSHFGTLGVDVVNNPSGRVTDEQYSLIVNQYNAIAAGTYSPGSMTISSYGKSGSEVESTVDPQLSNIVPTADNADKLTRGQLVNVWNQDKGVFEPQPPRNAGIANGQLQVVVAYQMPDGSTMAQTQVVYGKRVSSEDGETRLPLWSFTMPDGSINIVGNDGNKYDPSKFTSLGDGTFTVSGEPTSMNEKIQRVYISVKDTRETDEMLRNRPGENYLEKIAPANLAYAETLRVAAAAAVDAAAGILDPAARADLLGDGYVPGDLNTVGGQLRDIVIGSADEISAQAYSLMENPSTGDRALAAEYSGRDDYATFLRTQSANYNEIRPNVWVPKPELVNKTGGITSALGNLGLWAQENPILSPLAVLPGMALTAGAIAENVVGFGRPETRDFRTEEQKRSEMAQDKLRGAVQNAQQIASVQGTGYNLFGNNPFFRNVEKATTLATPTVIQPTGYLGLQATVPRPSVPKAVTPSPYVTRTRPVPIGVKPATVPAKLVPIINSGPRAGQPAGGGL